jgi:hypothetical protein
VFASSETSLLAINAIATPPYCGCHDFLFVECGFEMRHRQMLGQIDGLEHERWVAQTEAMGLSRFPCEYLLYAKAYPITYPW